MGNQRIIKNTILLYIRQFVNLAIALFTSRITLNILGESDFGIYTAVGGITALLSVITSSLSSSTQRFMTFELGSKNFKGLNTVYVTSVQVHVMLSIILVIIAEIFAPWFISTQMTIPPERLSVALGVFQLSLLNCVVNLLNIPNNATIIAHEDMGTFAMLSLVITFLNLISVVSLQWIPWDKLLMYAILLSSVQLTYRVICYIYCKRKYPEAHYVNKFDINVFRKILGLASWNLLPNIALVGFTQGINVLFNMFFGTLVNAAYSVAMQAYSGVRSFCSNFQLASNPQIVKLYSANEFVKLKALLEMVEKMSFLLVFFISFPFILYAENILDLWLVNVPEHSVNFFRLLMLFSYIHVFSYPLDICALATGKVKKYNITTSLFLLSVIPIGYCLFRLGSCPEYIYYLSILVAFCGLNARLYLLSKLVDLDLKSFVNNVMFVCIKVIGISSFICLTLIHFCNNLYNFSIFSFLSIYLINLLIIYKVGFANNERKLIMEKLNSFFNKIK